MFFDFFEGLEFGFSGIVFVERVAAADEAVAGCGGAVAEGAADEFLVESAFGDGIGEDGGVAQRDAAAQQADTQIREAIEGRGRQK